MSRDKYKVQRLHGSKQQKIIETMLRRECDIRLAVKQYRCDRAGGGNAARLGVISDPTANEALRNIEPIKRVTLADGTTIERPEDWLMIIDSAYAQFADNNTMLEALQMRFRRGVYYKSVCRRFHISEGSFYFGVRTMMNFALAAACQLGLVSVL